MSKNAKRYWLVPKGCFIPFSQASYQNETFFHISNVIPHDDATYLVELTGSYPFLESKMNKIIGNYEKKANFSIQKWIDFELERIVQILPGQIETNPASFSCGHTTGYKACLLDLDKLLDKDE